MYKLISILFLSLTMLLSSLVAQDTTVVTGTLTADATWTSDKVWVLDGYVVVDNNVTLTIEAGTVVLAEDGQTENASALIIERDAILIAEGTAEEPIIFSSIQDDVNDPDDFLDKEAQGLWGGIIMCGDAPANTANNGSEQIEGIPSSLPANVATFGGNEPEDSSGVMRYVSIRHTGVALASNDEIQGLSLAGVGNRTVLEYIESYASADDGIEIFGGTVNMKYVSIFAADDDGLDYDQGWTGNIQYLFVMQASDNGGSGGEWDGADSPEDGTPFSNSTIYNMTMIGNAPAGDNNLLANYRANGGGKVYNSVMIEFEQGVSIQYKADDNVPESSYKRFQAGELDMTNNVFWEVAGNDPEAVWFISPSAGGWTDSAATVDAAIADIQGYFPANNDIVDPQIAGLSYADDKELDPRFRAFAVNSNVKTVSGDFFEQTSYKGAFGPSANGLWIKGWTALDHYGYLVESPSDLTSVKQPELANVKIFPNPTSGMITITAADLEGTAVQVTVMDLQGREVLRRALNPVAGALNAEIDLSAEAAGLYVVRVQQGEKASTARISVR